MLKITNIIFGGSDRQGNIVVPFGGTIYNSVQYIKPKIVVGSEYYGTHEVEFSLSTTLTVAILVSGKAVRCSPNRQ